MKKFFSINIFRYLKNKEKIEYLKEIINKNGEDDALKLILDEETISLEIIPYLKSILKEKNNDVNKIIFDKLLLLNKYDVALEFNKKLTKKERKLLLTNKYNNKEYRIKKENKYKSYIPTVGLATILILESTNIISGTHSAVTTKYKSSKTTSTNTYLEKNNVKDISNEELNHTLDKITEELGNQDIKFRNNGKDYIYKNKDLGLNLNKENITNTLIANNTKIDYNLKNTIINEHELLVNNISYNNESIQNVINDLYIKTKVNVINGSITKLDGTVIKETKASKGFELNTNDLEEKLNNIKYSSEIIIDFSMNEIQPTTNTKELYSSVIGTISSATTYYNESQGRSKNIKIAVEKINGKVLMPGEIFSFRNIAGPYNETNGYIFYAKDMGSGVCQVVTTLYNAQLKAGLETVSRSNHYEPVSYVNKGLDATVYSTSVDYQFKNNTNYPITIVASASNGVLTVGISGDSNILEGKSYLPRSVSISSKIYDAYLDVYKNGTIIETRYLGRSYYKY